MCFNIFLIIFDIHLIIFRLEGSQRQQNSFPPSGKRQKVETGTSFRAKLCYSAPMAGHFLTKNNFIGARSIF